MPLISISLFVSTENSLNMKLYQNNDSFQKIKSIQHLVINLHSVKYLAPGFLEIELSISFKSI